MTQQRKDSVSNQLVASDTRSGVGRDFFSNISSDLNGFAAQTSSMFSDLFGTFGIFSYNTLIIKNSNNIIYSAQIDIIIRIWKKKKIYIFL